MSAFIVDPETMDRVVGAILYDHPRLLMSRHHRAAVVGEVVEQERADGLRGEVSVDDALGRALYAMNERAVNYRYPDHEPQQAPAWKATQFCFHGAPAAALKAIDCLLYQCAEGDVPKEPLYVALTDFAGALARAIVTDLPAYQAAAWG